MNDTEEYEFDYDEVPDTPRHTKSSGRHLAPSGAHSAKPAKKKTSSKKQVKLNKALMYPLALVAGVVLFAIILFCIISLFKPSAKKQAQSEATPTPAVETVLVDESAVIGGEDAKTEEIETDGDSAVEIAEAPETEAPAEEITQTEEEPEEVPVEPVIEEDDNTIKAVSGTVTGRTELAIAASDCSSYLTEGRASYFSKFARDSISTTCWCEGVEGNGVGEWIIFEFNGSKTVSEITFRLGFWGDRYSKNSRPSKLKLEFSDGTSVTVSFTDAMEAQTVTLPTAVKTSSIKFTVLDVYAGSETTFTCISEITAYS